MPIYEYKCRKCGYEFEELQSIASALLTTCPKCGSKSIFRLISGGSGLIFKGSGFYATDYRKSGGDGSNGEGSKKKESTPAEKGTTSPNDS
jgi:putative FmdB family regulatory protein